jgi:hypothetical protein
LFTQAAPQEHLPLCDLDGPPHWEKMFAACSGEDGPSIIMPYLVRLKEWNDDGWLDMNDHWRQVIANGTVQRARLSLVEYFKHYLNFDISQEDNGICYAPGAILLVKKERILAQPRAIYERLLETVSQSSGPEEAHYLERAWVYLFSAPKATVHSTYLHGTVEEWLAKPKEGAKTSHPQ